jgi:hypothetical protein
MPCPERPSGEIGKYIRGAAPSLFRHCEDRSDEANQRCAPLLFQTLQKKTARGITQGAGDSF